MSSNYSKPYKFINRRKVSIRTKSTETPASARANDGLGRQTSSRTKSPTTPYEVTNQPTVRSLIGRQEAANRTNPTVKKSGCYLDAKQPVIS